MLRDTNSDELADNGNNWLMLTSSHTVFTDFQAVFPGARPRSQYHLFRAYEWLRNQIGLYAVLWKCCIRPDVFIEEEKTLIKGHIENSIILIELDSPYH